MLRTVRLLTIVVVGIALASASCACGTAPVETLELPHAREEDPALVPRRPDTEVEASPALPRIDVAGRVVDDRAEPMVGRSVVAVDAAGRRTEVMTDEAGGFYMFAVRPPYDLVVAAAPSGSVMLPVALLGLRSGEPRIELFERHDPTPRPRSREVRVRVPLPPCRPEATCWLSVVTTSTRGKGRATAAYELGAPSAALIVEHFSDETADAPDDEHVDVHALVGNAECTEYWYGSLRGAAWSARDMTGKSSTTDVVLPTLTAVDASPPVSISVVSPWMLSHAHHPIGEATAGASEGSDPADWRLTIASELDLGGRITIPLRRDWSASSSLRLPLIPGAVWRVRADAEHVGVVDGAPHRRASTTTTTTLPLTTPDVALVLQPPPSAVRPMANGSISRRGVGFSWGEEPSGVSSVTITALRGDHQRFRVFTSSPQISLARLEQLGFARLLEGPHVLERTTWIGRSLESLTSSSVPTSSSAELSTARADARADAGAARTITYERFDFVVTR